MLTNVIIKCFSNNQTCLILKFYSQYVHLNLLCYVVLLWNRQYDYFYLSVKTGLLTDLEAFLYKLQCCRRVCACSSGCVFVCVSALMCFPLDFDPGSFFVEQTKQSGTTMSLRTDPFTLDTFRSVLSEVFYTGCHAVKQTVDELWFINLCLFYQPEQPPLFFFTNCLNNIF